MVYQYAQKFNNLCQYGGYHVDTDMKKMELFCEGLNSELSGWLSLVQFDSYHMLVNKAISQEDAMKRAQAERKRKANSMHNNAQLRKFHMVQKTPLDFQQTLPSGRWVKQSQDRSQETVNFPKPQRQTPQLTRSTPPPTSSGRRCDNCGDPKHFARECPTRKQSKPKQSNQGLGHKPNKQGKK
jgi:hypothetical protein